MGLGSSREAGRSVLPFTTPIPGKTLQMQLTDSPLQRHLTYDLIQTSLRLRGGEDLVRGPTREGPGLLQPCCKAFPWIEPRRERGPSGFGQIKLRRRSPPAGRPPTYTPIMDITPPWTGSARTGWSPFSRKHQLWIRYWKWSSKALAAYTGWYRRRPILPPNRNPDKRSSKTPTICWRIKHFTAPNCGCPSCRRRLPKESGKLLLIVEDIEEALATVVVNRLGGLKVCAVQVPRVWSPAARSRIRSGHSKLGLPI